ncbi:MAG: branched-chain amino acid aminotransferase [Clostridia bacterium]|nr:branched-chain amino acid aminotransferase [Clostridia bacterium]MBQ8269192.1 branched-chain amino acid aminotransferase [Clostridia bacterium]MBR2325523.1 branched-chain amino acid aminotransferase [Clostridia bacterium]
MEIKIIRNENPKVKPEAATLGFGKYFTDHMFIMDYTVEKGWHDARIVPFGKFEIHPASTALHYGSEIFEGLKAYRKADGSVQMFRPMENVRRMNRSAERLCLPEIPEDMALEILEKFISFEQEWTPSEPGTSLYIRPFMFGNDETLGVHAVHSATFMIILSPVGSYYKEGINPVKIMIEDTDVRAVRGGTGEAKCGGNYAASNRAGERAAQQGYSQVLWLDGVERKYIEEVGAMNVMFKIAGEIVTPALAGSILPGITRKSCLELLRKEGYKVSERLLSVDELAAAMENGTLEEAWGCGTAAVISPIGELAYKGKKFAVNGGKIGEVTQHLYDTLTGIQWGKLEDTFGWTYPVK